MNHFWPSVFFIFVFLGLSGICYSVESESSLFDQSLQFYKNGNFEESLKVLSKLVKLNSTNSLYWFNLGNCFFMSQSYDRAISSYQKVILLKGNIAPAAKLYQAKALRMLAKNDEAAALLHGLISGKPPLGILSEARADLELLHRRQDIEEEALSLYQTGNFQSAETMLKQKPEMDLSTSGRLLLGLTLAKENKIFDAERVLKNLTVAPFDERRVLDPEDQRSANEILKRIRRNEVENRPYWMFLDLAYGFASNVYLDGKSSSPISSSLLHSSFGAGYHFDQGHLLSEKIGYILFYERPEKATDLQTLAQTLQASILYEKLPIDLSLTPYLQQHIWNGVVAANKVGVSFKSVYTQNAFETGADLDGSSQMAGNSEFAYLSGSSYSVRPYFGIWSTFFYAQAYWFIGSDGTQDIVYSDGSRLPLQHSYQGPGIKTIWKLSSEASFIFGASCLQRTYRNLALYGNKQRKDQELGANLKLNYSLTPQFLTYALYEYVVNSSTLGSGDVRDKNYDSSIISVGMSWDFFK